MNRVEKRRIIHNLKNPKGLRKKHTKGAFGLISPKASQQLDLRVIPKLKRKPTRRQIPINEPKSRKTVKK